MVFRDRLSIYEKKRKIGRLHIWMNSYIFLKHYNFHKISIDNGQLCWTNPYKKNMYYRVYTLKVFSDHFITLLYKYLFWCYGYNLY